MRVPDAIGQALVSAGVDQVFGVVGSGNFRVTEALRREGARFVAARQETSAVTAADGYATVTGRPTVVTVHQGPGYTNALTGMVEAAKSRSPVLLVAADTPDAWLHSNFRVGQAAMAEAGGIEVVRPTSARDVGTALARAWQLVAGERRATALLLPLDVQDEELDAPIERLGIGGRPPVPDPDRAAIERAVALAREARRPVVLAGRGAVLAGARGEIELVAERIGAPLATSVVANGLFGGNPWNLGISGGFATPLAAELIADADLLVVFGASLTRWTTKHGRLIAEGTQIVQVDHDPAAVGLHHPVAIGIVADVRAAAHALADSLDPPVVGRRSPELAARISHEGSWRDLPFADASSGATIDPRTLTVALDRLLPDERTMVVDGGHFSGWPTMYLRVPDAAGSIFHQAFQSIGLGLGTAIGAAVGRPDRLTVAALGDGCAFMALGELETATRIGAPLLVLVYNDAAYGAEVHHFADDDVSLDTVRFPPTDLAAVGRALGADGVTVRGLADLDGVREWVSGPQDRPLVVDAKVTPNVVGSWLPEAFRA